MAGHEAHIFRLSSFLPPSPIVQLDGLQAPNLREVEEIYKSQSLFVTLSLQVEEIFPKSLSTEYQILPYYL